MQYRSHICKLINQHILKGVVFMQLNLDDQQVNNPPISFKKRQNFIAIIIGVVTSFNVVSSIPKGTTIEPLNKLNELTAICEAIVNNLISFLVN